MGWVEAEASNAKKKAHVSGPNNLEVGRSAETFDIRPEIENHGMGQGTDTASLALYWMHRGRVYPWTDRHFVNLRRILVFRLQFEMILEIRTSWRMLYSGQKRLALSQIVFREWKVAARV